MPKFKRRQRRGLPFGLFLAVVGALLLPIALAPRTNAEVDANFSWTGATNTTWSTSTNWSPTGPPSGTDTALFNSAFSNQPNIIADTVAVGTLHMATGVAQNVTISASAAQILTIAGRGIPGTGILIDNASAFTLTITARLGVDASQAWTNNSGNLSPLVGPPYLSVRLISLRSTAPETRLSQPLSVIPVPVSVQLLLRTAAVR